MVNVDGLIIDISWLAIISTVLAAISILISTRWIMEPIQVQTNKWIGSLPLLPLFLFRMLSWVIIITSLKSYALVVILIFEMMNYIILRNTLQKEQRNQIYELMVFSAVFPIYKYPMTESCEDGGMRVFFWLLVSGNVMLMASISIIFSLYWTDLLNPWCSSDQLLVPEEMSTHIFFLAASLFAAATLPVILINSIESKRSVLLLLSASKSF